MTKLLLIAVLVFVAYMLWRAPRVRERPAAAPPKPVAGPQDMVSCPVCSVHIPRSEALPGPDDQLYCSQEHRLTARRG